MSARASQVKASRSPQAKSLKVVRRRERRLVRRRGGRRVAPAIAIGALFIGAAVFAVLLAQVMLAQSGFKMAQMREQMAAAEERHSRLVLTAAKLGSAERIERVAMRDLGMIYPQEIKYIIADVRGGTARRLAERDSEPLLPIDGPAAALGGAP